jgi:hypothetical protein
MAGSNEPAVIDYVGKTVVGLGPTDKRLVHAGMAPLMPAAAKSGAGNRP